MSVEWRNCIGCDKRVRLSSSQWYCDSESCRALKKLKQAAMDAEEIFTLDELEEHADVLRNECAGLP